MYRSTRTSLIAGCSAVPVALARSPDHVHYRSAKLALESFCRYSEYAAKCHLSSKTRYSKALTLPWCCRGTCMQHNHVQ